MWTSSQIEGKPVYNKDNRHWDVIINRNGTRSVLHPTHIVMATGALGGPVIVDLPGQSEFKGTALHASDYQGGPPYAGKRAIVIGAGNSSIDICQDLCFHKAKSVTMVQRSVTCVIGGETTEKNLMRMFKDDEPCAVGDLKFSTMPIGLLKKIQRSRTQEMWDEEPELFEKLRKGGVKLYMGPNGEGQLIMALERGGGTFAKHYLASMLN